MLWKPHACQQACSWGPGARSNGSEVLFLPTRTLALLDALCAALPAHTLLAADFDALPDRVLPGTNAPLVASTVRPAAGTGAVNLSPCHESTSMRCPHRVLLGTNTPLVASSVARLLEQGVQAIVLPRLTLMRCQTTCCPAPTRRSRAQRCARLLEWGCRVCRLARHWAACKLVLPGPHVADVQAHEIRVSSLLACQTQCGWQPAVRHVRINVKAAGRKEFILSA